MLVPWALTYCTSLGIELGVLQGELHGLGGADALRVRRGDVVRVGRAAAAEHLGVDAGAALLGVFEFFEDDDAGALAEDEAVAVLVERPAGALSGSSLRMRQGAAAMKPPRPIGGDGRLGAAGDHDVGVVPLNGVQGVADGVGGRGAGRRNGGVRTAQAEMDRDVAGGGVGDHLRDDERADAAGPVLDKAGVLLFEFVEAADAAADDDAAAEGIFLGEVEAAVLDG